MNVTVRKLGPLTRASVNNQDAVGAATDTDGEAQASGTVLTFEAVYGEWFHDVCRWVRAFGGLDADLDDLAQEVFIVVRRKLPDFDGRNLKAWLYRIAKRTVRDYRRAAWFRSVLVRRGARDPEHALLKLVEPGWNPGEQLEQREAERLVTLALARLSHKTRTAFILFEIEGLSGEEIATLEGVPIDTVWSRLHQARKAFAKAVKVLQRTGGLS